MDTAFTYYRKSAKIRIAIAAALSLLIHVGFVAGAKLVPSRAQPMASTEEEVVIGDPDVTELVVPYDQPEETPPPDEPTPPPEETPEPEETPPPVEDMTFAEPTPEPTPEKPKAPRPPAPKFTGPIPEGAKRGPVYVPGVIGGNPNGTKPTGTPGRGNWSLPTPPFPPQLKAMRITGSGTAKITTDGSGHISSVEITQSAGAQLDNALRNFARSNWKGPPNSTRSQPFTYRLQ